MSAKYVTKPTSATLAAVVRFESIPTFDRLSMSSVFVVIHLRFAPNQTSIVGFCWGQKESKVVGRQVLN